MSLSVAQCRAARALLGWSAADLATAGGMGIMTIKRFEGGQTISAASTDSIVATLTAAGISLIPPGDVSSAGGEGVRLSPVNSTS